MERWRAFLSDGRTMVVMLLAMIAIGVAFGAVKPFIGGGLLDLISHPQANIDRLAEMNAAQRHAHIWVTLTLDSLYPIAYGGFLAGVALRFAPRYALAAASPALALVLVDIVENALIVAALLGADGIVHAKAYATHLKWWLFGLALLVSVVLAFAALLRHLFERRGGQIA